MDKDDIELKKLFAELIASFEVSLEILAAAAARSGDAEEFRNALLKQLAIAESGKPVSPLAIRLTTSALPAVEAVCLENRTNDSSKRNH